MKQTSLGVRVLGASLALIINIVPGLALAEDHGTSDITSQTQVNANLQLGEQEDGAHVNASTSLSGDRGDGEHSGTSSSASVSHEREQSGSHDAGDMENEIEINHDDALQSTSTIDSPDHVSNRGQLRSFLNHLVKEDSRVADVSVSSSTIETHFAMPAKFLWSIPTQLTANITIANDGSVTITYPWYAFLFATNSDELKTRLTQAASTSASTTFSANVQARLLNSLFSLLRQNQ